MGNISRRCGLSALVVVVYLGVLVNIGWSHGCVPECPDCHTCVDGECENDCPGGSTCCNGSCCGGDCKACELISCDAMGCSYSCEFSCNGCETCENDECVEDCGCNKHCECDPNNNCSCVGDGCGPCQSCETSGCEDACSSEKCELCYGVEGCKNSCTRNPAACLRCEEGSCVCDAEVNSISGSSYVCVNEDVTFTASVSKRCDCVNWSGGGDPATADGICSFVTKWATAGVKNVSAVSPCSNAQGESVYVGKVEIEEPNENPVTDNNFTFNSASPGVCCVAGTGTTHIVSLDGDLEWNIGDISGSTKTSTPDPPKGASITFRYTTLPSSNSEFGKKTLTLSHPDFGSGCNQDTQDVEIFFTKAAKNHSGTGSGTTPNWYYYWKDGGLCGIEDDVHYDSGGYYGYYVPGDNHVHICDAAPQTNTGPETYYKDDPNYSITVTATGSGPYCVAETIAHELYHKYIYETYNGQTDDDHDGVPNTAEGTLLGVDTLINDPDTYNMGGGYSSYGDNEIRCRKKELNHGIAVTTTNDWANPGTNSDK